jgi:hypothetical protein
VSALDKVALDELASWRQHPVSLAVLREIADRARYLRQSLRNAAVDSTLDRIRRLSGAVEEIEWMEKKLSRTDEATE